MKKAFKTTFLYIGTAIGAGFSSGREIALFFGDVSPLNVAISSLFMSMFCGLFLIAGKNHLIPKGKLISFAIFVCASISLCAMLAGGDYIMFSMTGIPVFLGLAMTILGGIVVVLGIEKIKVVNSILVPLIIICIALLYAKLPPQNYTLPFTLSKPFLYSGLDVLLGGVIISQEGEKLSYKEIFLSCALTCGFMFGMLYMLQTIVLADTNDSLMPVLAISQMLNLKPVCGVLIGVAIFTTLVSSLKIVSDYLSSNLSKSKRLHTLGAPENKSIIVFFCLVVCYPLSFFGFNTIVDNLYPLISVCGVILTIIVIIKAIIKSLQFLRSKRTSKNNATDNSVSGSKRRSKHNKTDNSMPNKINVSKRNAMRKSNNKTKHDLGCKPRRSLEYNSIHKSTSNRNASRHVSKQQKSRAIARHST